MWLIIVYKGINVYCCCVCGYVVYLLLMLKGFNVIEYVVCFICYICDIVECFCVEGLFDELYDVLFIIVQMSMIQGGNVINMVLVECCFDFEFCNLLIFDFEQIFMCIEVYVQEMLLLQMLCEYLNVVIEFLKIVVVFGFDVIE